MIATALSSCFAPGAVYSFPARLAHVVSARSQSTILSNCLGCLLLIRVRNDSIPVDFCAIVACIYPLGAYCLTAIFFRLWCNHLFSALGPGHAAEYLCKIHMDLKT